MKLFNLCRLSNIIKRLILAVHSAHSDVLLSAAPKDNLHVNLPLNFSYLKLHPSFTGSSLKSTSSGFKLSRTSLRASIGGTPSLVSLSICSSRKLVPAEASLLFKSAIILSPAPNSALEAGLTNPNVAYVITP
uniref:Uncharacterized protein n=1 Tax=Cacopsylla melanoneura TaxID=428564 RepID=A0A8D8VRK3_9HEMI